MVRLLPVALLSTCLLACSTTVNRAGEPPAPRELASRVDLHLATAQQAAGESPVELSSDSEFLRRIYLDLTGRIPTVAEAHEFLQSAAPQKRLHLVNELVGSGAHASHMATFWRRTWIPQTDTPQFRRLSGEFEQWMAMQLTLGRSYDQIVHDLLTVDSAANPTTDDTKSATELRVPDSFLTASLRLPENLAANTTRAFLGVNLDCAQCHDHPFSRWTQEQFWETAAFFARPATHDVAAPTTFSILIPETQSSVQATLFTGEEIQWPKAVNRDSGRRVMADWVTADENPYFARNAVNRMWAYYFGRGLVEPLDDMTEANPASHPAILAELSQAFVQSGFDLHYLSETIVLTKAYQRTSRQQIGKPSQVDPDLYLRAKVRGLSGEQLHASLRQAAGLPVIRHDLDPTQTSDNRERFIAEFFVEDAANAQRSILQALALMNGEATSEATGDKASPLLRALAEAPFLNNQDRVRALFLATLSRQPEPEELNELVPHLEQSSSHGQALGEIMWALLNSAEFNTNH